MHAGRAIPRVINAFPKLERAFQVGLEADGIWVMEDDDEASNPSRNSPSTRSSRSTGSTGGSDPPSSSPRNTETDDGEEDDQE